MPFLTGRTKPWHLEALDQYINDLVTGGGDVQALRDRIGRSRLGTGFQEGSFFSPEAGSEAEDDAAQQHWLEDWVGDPPRRGGNFWPYAYEVDVAEILQQGLLESLDRVRASGKVHQYVWVPNASAPAAWANESPPYDAALDKARASGDAAYLSADQQQLFRVSVQESAHVVSLVLETPAPLAGGAGAETATPGEEHPGLVTHMSIGATGDGRLTFQGWSRPAQTASGRGAATLRRATGPARSS